MLGKSQHPSDIFPEPSLVAATNCPFCLLLFFFYEHQCSASSQAIPSARCPKGCQWSPMIEPRGGTARSMVWRSPGDFTLKENSRRDILFPVDGFAASFFATGLVVESLCWQLDWINKTAIPRPLQHCWCLELRSKLGGWFWAFFLALWGFFCSFWFVGGF